jgi:ribosomal protein S18 acetylase RimI-like enzyme
VYTFRPFRNSDPPRLAEIWREQPPLRGRFPAMTSGILDQLVLSKPYFDERGLIVAVLEDAPVGFVHAGFGPDESEQSVSRDTGMIYQLMMRSAHREPSLADELIHQAEAYLRGAGAKVLYAGGIRPFNAFYLGLYGGSELPGVLAGDAMFVEACRRNGYREIDHVNVLQRELAIFRAPVTRSQRQLRREVTIREQVTPRVSSWWTACTTGGFEVTGYEAIRTRDETSLADVLFWDIEPLSVGWGAPTVGMFDLRVDNDRRRQGVATLLLSDAFSKLATRGVVRVEAQTMQQNLPAIGLYRQLGFDQVDEGIVFRKEAS